MELSDDDLEISQGCMAMHPNHMGGQHVAKPCTGVMVLHKPTGVAVRCNSERSQLANKLKAIAKLRLILSALKSLGEALPELPT